MRLGNEDEKDKIFTMGREGREFGGGGDMRRQKRYHYLLPYMQSIWDPIRDAPDVTKDALSRCALTTSYMYIQTCTNTHHSICSRFERTCKVAS